MQLSDACYNLKIYFRLLDWIAVLSNSEVRSIQLSQDCEISTARGLLFLSA